MPDVRSEETSDEEVPQSGTLAPACGQPFIKDGFRKIPVLDECLCGCRGDDFRCERWDPNVKGPTSDHPCC